MEWFLKKHEKGNLIELWKKMEQVNIPQRTSIEVPIKEKATSWSIIQNFINIDASSTESEKGV